MARTVHRGRWSLEDRAENFYQELPVDVPAGASALAVRLAFDRGAGVLDLGCFSPAGFRGWSGGARDSFTITADRATPGYLPGPLDAGTWHVCLGLHRVPVEGLAYELVVDTSADAPPPVP
ncbi:PHP domain-containing protein, partial [Pseudonocardia xinjiangensis]|nr:PHP domain-containing protein [Pseudonocardia xinjiangensis]